MTDVAAAPTGGSDGRSILVTNDDGVDSPALLPLADALDDLGEVRIVVPDGERSWSGKAMTRFADVTVAEVERGGRTVVATTGSPADAAQIGCGLLAPGPDLVVSGINLGHNHGSAFVLSSGTIGAAAEAVLLGRTAVALSTGTMDDDWAGWRRMIAEPAARSGWERLAGHARRVLDEVLVSGLVGGCDLVSVNLPWGTDDDTPWRVTTLAPTRYGPMMLPDTDGRWAASYGGLEVLDVVATAETAVTDIAAAEAGMVSITPLNFPTHALVDDHVRDHLERG